MTQVLEPDTRIIVIRRGELMRLAYPFTQEGLDTTSPPELAASAITLFMQLQKEYPGRADLPITEDNTQLALALPFADDILDWDQPLWTVLAGYWKPYDIEVIGDVSEEMKQYPALALNLVDLHKHTGKPIQGEQHAPNGKQNNPPV